MSEPDRRQTGPAGASGGSRHPGGTMQAALRRTTLSPSDRTRRRSCDMTRWSSGSQNGSDRVVRAERSPRRARGSAQMERLVYELRVRGPVPPELLEEIGAEDFGEEPPLTILRTEPTDQPGLHGMLQRLRSLGLDLLEVRTTGPESFDEVATTGPESLDEVP